MPDLQISPLALAQRPLLDKFYRAERSPMRVGNAQRLWVARCGGIVAGLCLSAVDDGHWLTGLWVASQARGAGVGSRLLGQVIAETPEPIWLFCNPHLLAFYQPLGFAACDQLPQPLHERLMRYRQSKRLLALHVCGAGLPAATP